jgi:hypothetical protein
MHVREVTKGVANPALRSSLLRLENPDLLHDRRGSRRRIRRLGTAKNAICSARICPTWDLLLIKRQVIRSIDRDISDQRRLENRYRPDSTFVITTDALYRGKDRYQKISKIFDGLEHQRQHP